MQTWIALFQACLLPLASLAAAVGNAAARLEWVGHDLLGSHKPPPNCGLQQEEEVLDPDTRHFLWLDTSLRAPGPRVQLSRLYVAAPPEASIDSTHPRSIAVIRVRSLMGKLSLEEVRVVDLETVEESPFVGSSVLDGAIDFTIDADAGDILGILSVCAFGDIPVAALLDGPGDMPLPWARTFMMKSIELGTELSLSASDFSMPPAWAFTYSVLPLESEQDQRRSESKQVRGGGVLQLLSKVNGEAKCHNEHALLKNVRHLSARCKWVLRYPLYVLHTARMEDVGPVQLLQWFDSVRFAAHPELDIRFVDVSEEFQQVRIGGSKVMLDRLDVMWFDAPLNSSPQIRKVKPRRWQAGYRHMCRFQSAAVFQLPVFQRTRYMLHLDTDATFDCRSEDDLDPIEEMARTNSVYGLFEVGVEDPAYSQGWTGFVKEWSLLNEIQPAVPAAQISSYGRNVTKADELSDAEAHYEAPVDSLALTWGTAWEVLDLDFFTSEPVQRFSDRAESSLGHFRFLWGDHLVRAYQVQLFASLDRVRCFDAEELPGTHGCSPDGSHTYTGLGENGVYVYNLLDDLACPDMWLAKGIRGVPWPGGPHSGVSPRECLMLCNNDDTCQGFDIAYYADSDQADCVLRDGRANIQACAGGGIHGPALLAWGKLRIDLGVVTKVASANRYQLIEPAMPRSMNCSQWRQDLESKLRQPGAALSLQELP